MAASFPTSLKSFTSKTDNIDDVLAAHVNDIQDEVMALEGYGGGWTPAGETWTYASSITITISGDKTTKYGKGDKISFVQGGTVKYAYVISTPSYGAPNTTITVRGDAVANSAITLPYFSKVASPQGFPHWFDFVPAWTNLTLGNGTQTAKFMLQGHLCFLELALTLGGTSSVGTIPHFSPTVWAVADHPGVWSTAYIDTGGYTYIGFGEIITGEVYPWEIVISGSRPTKSGITATAPFTWATGDVLKISGIYRI